MKKNDIFETEIMDMTTEGSGVCRVDNMAVFVPHTAVGDRIRVRIVKVLKSYAFGIVEELLEPLQYPQNRYVTNQNGEAVRKVISEIVILIGAVDNNRIARVPVRRLSVSAYHV